MRIRMREELWILGFKSSIRPKTEKKSEMSVIVGLGKRFGNFPLELG